VSWAVIFLQIGGLSYWIYEKRNLAYARLVALLCGLLFVPFFEYWAGMEGWWYYQHCAMIFGKVPWYIIFSEAAICMVLPDLMIRIANRNTGFCILAGIGQGLWIWFTCMIAYYFSA
ncbi:MAG TPA: hypothetical protein PLP14_06100, partial [Chitinophagaceae bacterium]|nr:hypothetical protein [Chitinophagaceae bacterium]